MSVSTGVPVREHSHIDLQQAGPVSDVALEDRLCPGCKNSAVNDQGGLVVAFGSSFFHVDCFKCAKCHNQVTADTNLLLLSDGSPICADCSYSCNLCRQPILDEAIMAGDDSYHAHCFKCKVCKNRIDELVFAKTSQGIYCMKCHNERMIRIRKHTQKKAEREKAQGGGSKSRERAVAAHHQMTSQRRPSDTSRPPPQTDVPLSNNASANLVPSSDIARQQSHADLTPSTTHGPSVNVVPSPPEYSEHIPGNDRHFPAKQHTLPVPNSNPNHLARRSASFDDGGLQDPRHPSEFGHQPTNNLSVTSRRDKRRSINPGLALNPFANISNPTINEISEATPRPVTDSSSRRGSRADSLHTESHTHTSRAPSPFITTQDHDETIVLRSPVQESPSNGKMYGDRSSLGPSPTDTRTTLGLQQRNGTPSPDTQRGGSRAPSPAHRADVPHGIESGTDTDDDAGHLTPVPPTTLPPKDRNGVKSPTPEQLDPQSPDGGDASDPENPQIGTTHSTYIAPALPPIRVSLTSELADFLNGKSISDLAALSMPSAPNSGQFLTGIDEEAFSSPNTPIAEDSSSAGHSSASVDHSDSLKSTHGSLSTQGTTIPSTRPKVSGADLVILRLREALENAKGRGAQQLKLDGAFVEAIISALDIRTSELNQMKSRFDTAKRTSKQYIEGFNASQNEYDRELKLRRDAEAEVTRLRVLLSGQAARISTLTGDSKRQEVRQQMTKDMSDSLPMLESDLSRLKVERDMTLAEMEEINSGTPAPALGRTLTKRLDGIRSQYQRDLIPLQKQRDQLNREIEELQAARDAFLEETAVLNARNEQLAQLSAVYTRKMETRMDVIAEGSTRNDEVPSRPSLSERPAYQHSQFQQSHQHHTLHASTSTVSMHEDMVSGGIRIVKPDHEITATPAKKPGFKWMGSKSREPMNQSAPPMPNSNGGVEFSKSKPAHLEHNFQQVSLLNFTRCKSCGDKMWGSQLRCTVCSCSIHVRCIANVQISCTQQQTVALREDVPQVPAPPSMFGRNLIEQVRADSVNTKDPDRLIPVIVEKCVDAVEALALDYEGIYRKTGGSSQSRNITALFERADYGAFDLLDNDRFNDICSVTSVLKNYFRALPVPLLTFDLHEQFIVAISVKEPAQKLTAVLELVNSLPAEHYYTLRKLMIHLHHVRLQSEVNRMTARNLGVVFGPTLMRSRDPSAEFSDMAGKSLCLEFLIENAPDIFSDKH